MQRATWHRWHSWCGIHLALFLCFILVTGTLAVISSEIDWLTNSAIRSVPLAADQPVAWSAIYQHSRQITTPAQILSISAPLHPGFAASVIVKKRTGERKRLYYNPVNGEYQGQGVWLNWQMVLRQLHRHLMLPATLGITLVTSTAFIFLGSLISGLALHRHWLTGLVTYPRRKNSRLLWTDLHKLAGLWSAWLLLIMSITGVWYLAERWGADAQYPKDMGNTANPLQTPLQPSVQTLELMIQASATLRPDLKIKQIRLPSAVRNATLVQGQAVHLLVRDRANHIAFDPSSADVLGIREATDLSFHARIAEAADPLHFGTWGGYPSKIAYFIFGLILTSLSITGTYLYALRIASGSAFRNSTAGTKWKNALRNMGVIKWFCLVLITASLIKLVHQLTS